MRPATLPAWARSPLLADGGVAVLLAVAAWFAEPASSAVIGFLVLLAAATACRRIAPVCSAAMVFFLAALALLADSSPALAIFVLFALYSVTAHGPVWANRLAYVASLAGLVLATVGASLTASQEPGSPASVVTSVAVITVVWLFGLLRRSRLMRRAAVADHARRLQIERDQQVQLTASNERTRIAREMHDVVADSLSTIVAQSDDGSQLAQADPQAAIQALRAVSDTGRTALADMHKILGVLRTATPDPPDMTLQTGRGDLAELFARARSTGRRVEVTESGQVRQLPPGLAMVVYRICQESLANVAKHGGPRVRTRVDFTWSEESLELSIVDDGPRRVSGPILNGAEHGLIGIRERADMYGGTVMAGPLPNGGFAVRVHLPLPEDARAPLAP